VLILALNPAVTHGTARSPGTFHEFTSAVPGCSSANRGRLRLMASGATIPVPDQRYIILAVALNLDRGYPLSERLITTR
jgi:hypothetical protein